jgi:phthalate 4,5-dioxygenase
VQKDERPIIDPMVAGALQGPAVMDGIGPSASWQDYWKEVDRARRQRAEWATPELQPAE